ANQGGGQTRYTYSGGAEDFGGAGFSDFFETLFGGGGFGSSQTRGKRRGSTRTAQVRGEDLSAELSITLDDAYHGAEKLFDLNGQSIKLKIKPGINDGQVLKLAGKGYAGSRGAGAGDLMLKINVLSDPVFERKGNDLYTNMNVNLYTAVMGGKAALRTFKGTINVSITKESQNGKVMRLQGMGMPVYGKPNQFGDLYAKISVDIPTGLTEKETQLFQELQKLRK
ncbi:MAG: J domain-containing protein, partial [Ignavibacteria bacterium]